MKLFVGFNPKSRIVREALELARIAIREGHEVFVPAEFCLGSRDRRLGIRSEAIHALAPDFCAFVTREFGVMDDYFLQMLVSAKRRALPRCGYIYKTDKHNLIPPATFAAFENTVTERCTAVRGADEVWNLILMVKDWKTISL